MPTCKLCQAPDVKLVKAHIIPRSLYGGTLTHESGLARLITNMKDRFTRRSPIGIYDSNIVCEPCERLFSPWDHYARTLLFDTDPDTEISGNGEMLGYIYNTPDYPRLKLFFISLIWRAHWCSDDFFAGVDIGDFEHQAREMIIDAEPGPPEVFSIVLARFDEDIAEGFLNPFRERYAHVNVYRFFFARHVAYIKVDKRNTDKVFAPVILAPDRHLLVFAREFKDSKEIEVMRKLVTQ